MPASTSRPHQAGDDKIPRPCVAEISAPVGHLRLQQSFLSIGPQEGWRQHSAIEHLGCNFSQSTVGIPIPVPRRCDDLMIGIVPAPIRARKYFRSIRCPASVVNISHMKNIMRSRASIASASDTEAGNNRSNSGAECRLRRLIFLRRSRMATIARHRRFSRFFSGRTLSCGCTMLSISPASRRSASAFSSR